MIKVCRDIRKTVLYTFDISVIWEVNMILGPNFPYKPFSEFGLPSMSPNEQEMSMKIILIFLLVLQLVKI